MVTMPDESEQVRYAVLEGVPAQEVSRPLHSAYRRLMAALVAAAHVRS